MFHAVHEECERVCAIYGEPLSPSVESERDWGVPPLAAKLPPLRPETSRGADIKYRRRVI